MAVIIPEARFINKLGQSGLPMEKAIRIYRQAAQLHSVPVQQAIRSTMNIL